MKKLFVLCVLMIMARTAFASDTLRIGRPGYGGSGCRAGTASVTLAPDQKSLSILFDEYVAEAGARKSLDRKSCNIAIPVHVPQGYAISIFKVDYRGFVDVPRGGYGKFNVEYFFAGTRGPRMQKTFPGGYSNDYFLTNTLIGQSLVWSRCGADVNLRINSSMMVKSNRTGEDAIGTVDSVDVDSGLIYHLRWKRCR